MSLTTLGKCIFALSKGERAPFRESVLTRILSVHSYYFHHFSTFIQNRNLLEVIHEHLLLFVEVHITSMLLIQSAH